MTIAVAATRTRAVKLTPAVTRSRYHQYTYDGVTYPGVTGIIKVLDKSDALMAWAARNTAEAALAQIDNLASLRDTIGPDGVIRALSARSGWKRDEAAAIGSDIHGMADLVAKGEDLPAVSDVIRQRVEHYANWWARSGWSVRLSEAYIINVAMGYGGTLDLLARDQDGMNVLADVKSGKNIYPEVRLQLAGYAGAELICPQDSPVVYPMPRVDRYVILHVTETGVRPVELVLTDEDRAAFAACIPLSRWHTGQGKSRL